MDAHLFRRFCACAQGLLVGSRIEKIQEPAPSLLAINLYNQGEKRQLCLHCDRKQPFCFFSRQRLTSGAAPSAFVMRLRKYAVGRKIAACVPQFLQRRLWLLLSGHAEKPGGALAAGYALWLLLDLRSGASLHFQPTDDAKQSQGEYSLPPEADDPRWPAPCELGAALADWRSWPVLTPALRRHLAQLEEPEQWALLQDLASGEGDIFLALERNAEGSATGLASVRAVSAWPLAPALKENLDEISGDDVLDLIGQAAQSLVLARLAKTEQAERTRPAQKRLRQIERLLEKLAAEEARLKEMLAKKDDALALAANLWRLDADSHVQWLELAKDEDAGQEARRIRLDARISLRANLERLFHAARRGKRGLEMLAPRRSALLEEAQGLRRALGNGEIQAGNLLLTQEEKSSAAPPAHLLAHNLPRRVQAFLSEDGFLLWRGRDAKGNQALLRKAHPYDIWLHAEGGPGAHVLIRRVHAAQEVPERTLEQAGCIAGCKSWRRDAASARILYAEARHVRPLRGASPGTVRIDKMLATREVMLDAGLETRLAIS